MTNHRERRRLIEQPHVLVVVAERLATQVYPRGATLTSVGGMPTGIASVSADTVGGEPAGASTGTSVPVTGLETMEISNHHGKIS
jgi:hypothetical protein